MNIGVLAELGLNWLWRASWQASVVAVFVLAAQWLCRTRLAPKWRSALWGLVLVRLMMPVAPESAWSVFNLARRDRLAPAKQSESVAFPPQDWPMPVGVSTRPISLSQSIPVATLPTPASPAKRSPREWWRAAGLLWAVGALAYGGWLFLGSRVLRRKLRNHTLLADTRILAALEQCRLALGLARAPEVWVTSAVDSPAISGLARCRLLLPPKLIETLSLAEWRHVFMHELAHVRRWDVQANWLMVGLQGVHWFNPLVWFAFGRMRADRELACDAAALACCGEDEVPAYGGTLIKLLEGFGGVSARTGLVGILETKKHIKNRIRMIATFRNSRPWPFLAVFLMAGLCVFAMTDAQKGHTPDQVRPLSSVSLVETNQAIDRTSPASGFFGTGSGHSNAMATEAAAANASGPGTIAAKTNSVAQKSPVDTSPGARRIRLKLSRIVLEEYSTPLTGEALSLGAVLDQLEELSRQRDPEHEGIRFVVAASPGAAPAAQTRGEPKNQASGATSTQQTENDLLTQVRVAVRPPLRRVPLAFVLQVVAHRAEGPPLPDASGLIWTVGDSAVILSPPTKDAERLESKNYRVDPSTFLSKVEQVTMPFPRLNSPAGEISPGGTNKPHEVESTHAGGYDGLTAVTRATATKTIQDYVRQFFSTATGANFSGELAPKPDDDFILADGLIVGESSQQSAIRPMYFNERAGVLFVRATRKELDLVEAAIRTVNWPPAQIINVSARLITSEPNESGDATVSQEDAVAAAARALTFSNIVSRSGYQSLWQAWLQQEGTRVIAPPNITTLSGRPLRVPFGKEGLWLAIFPEVADNGHEIRLKIDLGTLSGGRAGGAVPLWSTNVAIGDGKTAIFGSWIGEPPRGNAAQKTHHTSFTLCITPTIVDPAGNPIHPDEDAPTSPVAPTPKLAPPF